ncbi:MAG TPA: penicillin acylase family protein [Pseudonocardiaceae bacterium]|jgi:acyl-homoserine lactone acylase PvdQ|nr:penicillin acylase family protein [Pseudonocardiaceae bacterium]
MARPVRKLSLLAALVAVATGVALGVTAPANAAHNPRSTSALESNDYCGGQCSDILPPGENGNATLADILANKVLGTAPAHTADQLNTYGNLADNYQNLTNATIDNYFNDSSFGVPPANVESTISPRGDVTIIRDKQTGVPHIYGTTRSGTEYGAGYAAAQDRLWLMDLFRHVGRGELTSFAGGAVANRQLEQTFWAAAPYTEQDLQNQVTAIANSGPQGAQAMQDINSYLAGINAYITQAYNNRTFPGEYDLTGHINPVTNAGSITPFGATDLIAIASVIGALFGTGGGGEVQSALVKEAADAQYGVTKGDQVWRSFQEENDPEADLTLHDGQSFPYSASPANPQGVAMPDPGSVTPQQEVFDPTGSATSSTATAATRQTANTSTSTPQVPAANALPRNKDGSPNLNPAKGIFNNGVLPGNLLSSKHGMSNALVVSGQYTDDGHPIAVFGPQTGYFAPQLLMLEELQGPGISSRGAAFAGLSFYVELGRGEDYSWSATSAGQDITDTFAIQLCNPDGSPATEASNSYVYNGQCTAMDALEQDDSWSPTTADSTATGSYKLIVYRTNYGLVQSRATINGQPVAYTSQRSTYMHEAASIIGFQSFNDPAQMGTPQQFEQAASNINYTFNWFYVNNAHIAYYNSGWNPQRPANVDPNLPIQAASQYEWTNWDPSTDTAGYTASSAHPNSIDQNYYISWNNKQALNYTAAGYGQNSVYRSDLLDSRVKALINSGNKISRSDVVKAMEDAAVTDLRGEDVLPDLLQVINSQPVTDPNQATLVSELTAWQQAGSKIVETSQGSQTFTDAAAIQLMDAWWPLLVQAEFTPGMGQNLFNAMISAIQINESPSGGQTGPATGPVDANESISHKGSSFQFGWWGYVDKDLRALLGDNVQGPLGAQFCGGGSLSACRTALLNSLVQAGGESASQVYTGDSDCSAGNQWCADSIIQRPMGGITDGKITWQNRPTFQQVVQYTGHRS